MAFKRSNLRSAACDFDDVSADFHNWTELVMAASEPDGCEFCLVCALLKAVVDAVGTRADLFFSSSAVQKTLSQQ